MVKEPKIFYLTRDGRISQHRVRGAELAQCGILNPNQWIVVTTVRADEDWLGQKYKVAGLYNFGYDELKLGGHAPKSLIPLGKGEIVANVDIKTVF